jgi:hypothetical protein
VNAYLDDASAAMMEMEMGGHVTKKLGDGRLQWLLRKLAGRRILMRLAPFLVPALVLFIVATTGPEFRPPGMRHAADARGHIVHHLAR